MVVGMKMDAINRVRAIRMFLSFFPFCVDAVAITWPIRCFCSHHFLGWAGRSPSWSWKYFGLFSIGLLFGLKGWDYDCISG